MVFIDLVAKQLNRCHVIILMNNCENNKIQMAFTCPIASLLMADNID